MTSDLSRLRQVPVREVWPHEAHDFTTWLLENVDVLSEVLGMQLQLTEAEHKVGGFALDLVGTDLDTGETVIVENQLEQSDHGHLAQLLTYAGGTDPTTVVWCAPRFRDEHRAALDWLNERTEELTRFFAVEVSAVRIDDSLPAPLFRLVAQPNDWSKQVHIETAASLAGRRADYQQFWGRLLELLPQKYPGWTNMKKPSKLNWMNLPYGQVGIAYNIVFTRTGPSITLYFEADPEDENQLQFERFLAHRDILEQSLGGELIFDPMEGKKACRIRYDRPEGGNIDNEDEHDIYLDWFLEHLGPFRAATQQVRALISDDGPI